MTAEHTKTRQQHANYNLQVVMNVNGPAAGTNARRAWLHEDSVHLHGTTLRNN